MAPAVGKDLLTAFHPNGDALAITAGDGRIKVCLVIVLVGRLCCYVV